MWMWKGLVVVSLLAVGCDKPACQKLESALCAPEIKNAVACQAGQSMARQSSNDECSEALADLDTSVFLPAKKTIPAPTPAPGPEVGSPAPDPK